MALLFPSSSIASLSVGFRYGISVKLYSKTNPRNSSRNSNSLRDKGKIGIRFTGVRVGVCSGTKDGEVVEVSGFENKESISWQFSAPVTKQNREAEEKQNYYVNLGYAIRTLREDLREIFYRELCFDIYRDDIAFKDPLNTFVGKENYKLIFWALRFHGKLLFKALWVDILSMGQPFEGVIMVRWTIQGIPRVPWEIHGRFDGTSEYKLDKNGKIYEHRVDNIAFNSPPKLQVLAIGDLIQSLGCPSTPNPTYFEISSSLLMKSIPFLVVKYYLAFALALTWRFEAES
ncbi:uncharacterized protein LOC122648700 [Telopea speciosissima]|uniref:uncharacterized protein LOC122648700 n=1 Tax=Telopea speciosissima TaxID=54955 RepID=UPI001CC4E490|nr:uncharacterized protein LOC122648700 [Telopea speciosissima]